MAKDIRKASFTKDCIADALLRLMEKRTLSEIAIDEITSLAGVGRATYFRNFNSKYEVVAYKEIKDWFAYEKEHQLKPNYGETQYDQLLQLFRFFYNGRKDLICRHADPVDNANIWMLVFRETMIPQKDNELEDSYKIGFFSYALVGMIQVWIEHDFRETPEEIAGYIMKWVR